MRTRKDSIPAPSAINDKGLLTTGNTGKRGERLKKREKPVVGAADLMQCPIYLLIIVIRGV